MTRLPGSSTPDDNLLLVDGGTTNTRVYAVSGPVVLARGHASVGVRDSARDGSTDRLTSALRDLLTQVSGAAQDETPGWRPQAVVAAGMITSALGLADVPHVVAPAGPSDLAAAAKYVALPGGILPGVMLVPGVRCVPRLPADDPLASTDVMRGEESLCIGLSALGTLGDGGLVLTIGSHWKLIEVVADHHVAWSTTTLGGELLHALQSQTVLAASVEQGVPKGLDLEAVRAGVLEQDRSGLPRAAFCTRLLELFPSSSSSPRSRLSFLAGVVIGATLAGWRDHIAQRTVTVVGSGGVADAWHSELQARGCRVQRVGADEAERAFIAGLTTIARYFASPALA
jgi:2-dehydro-3-deoxygalactonokinase